MGSGIVIFGIISFVMSLSIVIASGSGFICLLRYLSAAQPINKHLSDLHISKVGTPTMGGLLIVLSSFASSCMLIDSFTVPIVMVFCVVLSFFLIGFVDDYRKLLKKDNLSGLTPRSRLLFEFLLVILIVVYLENNISDLDSIIVPFFGGTINLGILFLPFSFFVIAGSANAVNITDGLDCLASYTVSIAMLALSIICAFSSDPEIANLSIITMSFAGACIGFIWFNAYPAKIFMGDSGSLSMGALMGIVSIIAKIELAYAIIGMIFICEIISTVIQIMYCKYTRYRYGKVSRIFLMAPVHHHFEKLGMHEVTIVNRALVLAIIFGIIGVLSVL